MKARLRFRWRREKNEKDAKYTAKEIPTHQTNLYTKFLAPSLGEREIVD